MSIKKIDAVKYRANDYKVDKRGKRTPSKFAFWVRAGGQWTTAAESGDERAEKFRGVFSADVAALTLPEIIEACGLEVSDGVRKAAEDAEARLNAILIKREKREAETVAKGRDAFLAKREASAEKAWDRLKERVDERAKTDADTATATDTATDTDESATDTDAKADADAVAA